MNGCHDRPNKTIELTLSALRFVGAARQISLAPGAWPRQGQSCPVSAGHGALGFRSGLPPKSVDGSAVQCGGHSAREGMSEGACLGAIRSWVPPCFLAGSNGESQGTKPPLERLECRCHRRYSFPTRNTYFYARNCLSASTTSRLIDRIACPVTSKSRGLACGALRSSRRS